MVPTAPIPVARAATARAWGLLALRPLAFLAAQAAVALALALGGAAEPWWASAAWWPLAAILANVAGLAALAASLRAEGAPLRAVFAPAGGRAPAAVLGRDGGAAALAALPVLALGALVPWALGVALWGTPDIGQAVLVQPLPAWAAWATLVLFPVTMAAVELPTYAGFVAPRLGATRLGAVGAVVVVGLVLGLQHAALPFLPAKTFLVWRALALVPMALALIATLRRAPRLLPWFVALHLLANATLAAQVWRAST